MNDSQDTLGNCFTELKELINRRNEYNAEHLDHYINIIKHFDQSIKCLKKRLEDISKKVDNYDLEINAISHNLNSNTINLDQLQVNTNRIAENIDVINQKHDSLSTDLKGVLKKASNNEFNIEQARILLERLAEIVDNLLSRFVEDSIKEPLIKDLGYLYNHISIEAARNEDSDVLDSILMLISNVFEQNDIRIIKPREGDEFNPREHKAVSREKTEMEEHNNLVSRVIRAGFASQKRVLKPAFISLFQCEQKNIEREDCKYG